MDQVKEVLDRNDRFGHFSADFTKLLDVWRATHKREVYFVGNFKVMKTELEDYKTKLSNAERLIEENHDTIKRLQNVKNFI